MTLIPKTSPEAKIVRNKKSTDKLLRKLKRPKFPGLFVILISLILLAAGAVIWVVFFSGNNFISRISDPPADLDKMTVIVPWNPGSMADLTLRALTDSEVQNISGSNGAVGINEVYASTHDGLSVLGTNLSSVILSNLTGFTATGVSDWEFWFVAFSPAVAAVRGDSGLTSLDDLLSAAVASELTAANAGGGTMSYIAAHAFAEHYSITLKQIDYPGTNPAVHGVLDGAADFIIAPRSDIISFLNSGELIEIETAPLFLMDFGEWYGLMLPKGAEEDVLLFYDELWSEAVSSERFISFSADNGLLPKQPDREAGRDITAGMVAFVEKILFDSGYLGR